ncbi:hypothetical protein [Celeribacter sp. PS-C1]|uniref:hypothetical protein n=1 Tax=Celeribacter sp. PS-C1 TaxID=2820813 RepID=UPI001CA51BA2|nr:hypothetical protein [Celeribacter sp. PS-C1]MBW6419644.1 hypothetical protein [Celeribacter sp. PS-C1]
MARLTTAEHLQAVPAPIKRSMLAPDAKLAPGAAAVVGRFFRTLKETGDPHDNPSAKTFQLAAQSESTLATLLRALAKYAPQVSTATGRELRRSYYARRPGGSAYSLSPQKAGADAAPAVAPSTWPIDWQLMYVAMAASRELKPSSLKRHFASIDRCAAVLGDTEADGALNFYTAYCLGERFRELGLKHKTIAGYLCGLVSLGRHGGVEDQNLNGVRLMVKYHLDLASMEIKEKISRIEALIEKGGFDYIAQVIGELRTGMMAMPQHSAHAEKLRQTIALLALHINKPGRTGDVSQWRLGRELIRHPDGTWELTWEQEKTGWETSAGRLWHEVSDLLDVLILAGRPDRLVHLRYQGLQGANWLTLEERTPDRKLPSLRIKEAIGVPSHDLRTLAAEYLRQADPRRAPDIIQTHLGHRTLKAGEEYRIACKSDVAARDWLALKRDIAAGCLT